MTISGQEFGWTMQSEGMALTMDVLRGATAEVRRFKRDQRWADNEHTAKAFALRIGYHRAADPRRFLVVHRIVSP